MDDNSLLVIILAFILGCMCSGMMKQMCGGRLVEGSYDDLSELPVKNCAYRPFGRKAIMDSNDLDFKFFSIADNFELLKHYLDCEAGRDVAAN